MSWAETKATMCKVLARADSDEDSSEQEHNWWNRLLGVSSNYTIGPVLLGLLEMGVIGVAVTYECASQRRVSRLVRLQAALQC